jgi:hypothetical protein
MSDMNVTLSTDEMAMLKRLVESALGETRVEVHRTHFTPELREELKQEETLLRGLVEKFQRQPVAR